MPIRHNMGGANQKHCQASGVRRRKASTPAWLLTARRHRDERSIGGIHCPSASTRDIWHEKRLWFRDTFRRNERTQESHQQEECCGTFPGDKRKRPAGERRLLPAKITLGPTFMSLQRGRSSRSQGGGLRSSRFNTIDSNSWDPDSAEGEGDRDGGGGRNFRQPPPLLRFRG